MITLRNVVKSYNIDNKNFNALDGIDLDIGETEMLAVMGPSGSGKSTLLNILGGMDSVTSGEYIFDGIEVNNLKASGLHKFRRDNVSFVFQQFALMDKYTIFENVELPLIPKHISKLKRKKIVMKQLERMGIADQANKYPTQLSGGQQQRCAIARALASDNRLILADEPTGALDSHNGQEMMNILKEINKEGKTVVVITHDERIASQCNRIVYIQDGKITSE